MSKIEALILAVFFGLLPVVFCLVGTFIIGGILFGAEVFGPWVLWSLVPAAIMDAVFLKKWVKNAYQMSNKALAAIYLFWSVVALGLGMGVPIFNLALGTAAGVYAGRRMHLTGTDEQVRNRYFRKTALFCAGAMVLMCCLITLWAIAGQMIGYKFETPILSFTFTVPVFSAVVLTGGAIVVLLQYGLTRAGAKITIVLAGSRTAAAIITAAAVLIALSFLACLGWVGLKEYHAYRKQAAQERRHAAEKTSETAPRGNRAIAQ